MPTITLPLFPTLAALGTFASLAFEESDKPMLTAIASLLVSAMVYFAVYGFMAAAGLC